MFHIMRITLLQMAHLKSSLAISRFLNM